VRLAYQIEIEKPGVRLATSPPGFLLRQVEQERSTFRAVKKASPPIGALFLPIRVNLKTALWRWLSLAALFHVYAQ
jgi:hypothetical protein